MKTQQLAAAIKEASTGGADVLARVPGVYPASVKFSDGALFCMARTDEGKRLAIAGPPEAAGRFDGAVDEGVKMCGLNADNAGALRETFPWTAPVTIGRRAS